MTPRPYLRVAPPLFTPGRSVLAKSKISHVVSVPSSDPVDDDENVNDEDDFLIDRQAVHAELEQLTQRASARGQVPTARKPSVFRRHEENGKSAPASDTPYSDDDDLPITGLSKRVVDSNSDSEEDAEIFAHAYWEGERLASHLQIGPDEFAVIRRMYLRELKEQDDEDWTLMDRPPSADQMRRMRDLGIREERFVSMFSQVLDKSEDELQHMFQKVDANGDEHVTWTELVTYILQEASRHADTRHGKGTFTIRSNTLHVGNVHRNMIDRICLMDKGDTQFYITLGRDDLVQLWDARSLKPFRAFKRPKPVYTVIPPPELVAFPPTKTLDDEKGLSDIDVSHLLTPLPTRHHKANQGHGHHTDSASSLLGDGTGPSPPASSRAAEAAASFRHKWAAFVTGRGRLGDGPPPARFKGSQTARPTTDREQMMMKCSFRRASVIGMAVLDIVDHNNNSSSTSGTTSTDGGGTRRGEIVVHPPGKTKELPYALNAKPSSRLSVWSSCWATDAAFIPSTNKLFISSIDRHVYVVDTRREKFAEEAAVAFCCEAAPLTMAAHMHPLSQVPTLVLGDISGGVTAYNSNTYEKQASHRYHTESVAKVGFCFGVRLTSVGHEGRLVMVDCDRWDLIWGIDAHPMGIVSFAQSSAYKMLVTAGMDRKAIVWDPFLEEAIHTLPPHRTSLVDVAVSDAHNCIITAYADKTIKVWDIRRMQCLQTVFDKLHHPPDDTYTAMLFDEANVRLVTAGSKLRAWPLEDIAGVEESRKRVASPVALAAAEPKRHQAHQSRVIALLHADKYRQIVSVAVDTTVQLWNIGSGACTLLFYTPHQTLLTSACLDSLQRRLITASQDGVMKVWNVNNGDLLHKYPSRNTNVSNVLCLSAGSALPFVATGWDGCTVLNPDFSSPDAAEARSPPVILRGHAGDVISATTHGVLLAAGGTDGALVVWKVGSKAPYRLYRSQVPQGPSGIPGVEQIIFVRRGSLLVAATDDGDIHVYVSGSGRIVKTFAARVGHYPVLDTDMDGGVLAAGDASGHITLWKVVDNTPAPSESNVLHIQFSWLAHNCSISSLCIARDRPLLFSATSVGDVSVWDMRTFKLFATLCQQEVDWPNISSLVTITPSATTAQSKSRVAFTIDPSDNVDDDSEGPTATTVTLSKSFLLKKKRQVVAKAEQQPLKEEEEVDITSEEGRAIERRRRVRAFVGEADVLWEVTHVHEVDLEGKGQSNANAAHTTREMTNHDIIMDQISTRRFKYPPMKPGESLSRSFRIRNNMPLPPPSQSPSSSQPPTPSGHPTRPLPSRSSRKLISPRPPAPVSPGGKKRLSFPSRVASRLDSSRPSSSRHLLPSSPRHVR